MSTTITYDDFSFHATSAKIKTIYASDFSSGTDSWVGGPTYVTDPLTGSGKVLKKQAYNLFFPTSGPWYMRRYFSDMTVGKKYNLTGKVYIDHQSTNIQKILIYHMDGWYGLFIDKPSTAQWVEFSLFLLE